MNRREPWSFQPLGLLLSSLYFVMNFTIKSNHVGHIIWAALQVLMLNIKFSILIDKHLQNNMHSFHWFVPHGGILFFILTKVITT